MMARWHCSQRSSSAQGQTRARSSTQQLTNALSFECCEFDSPEADDLQTGSPGRFMYLSTGSAKSFRPNPSIHHAPREELGRRLNGHELYSLYTWLGLRMQGACHGSPQPLMSSHNRYKRWRTSSFSNQPLGAEIELLQTGAVINRLSGRGEPSAKLLVCTARKGIGGRFFKISPV
jgi:hypothetical protein